MICLIMWAANGIHADFKVKAGSPKFVEEHCYEEAWRGEEGPVLTCP